MQGSAHLRTLQTRGQPCPRRLPRGLLIRPRESSPPASRARRDLDKFFKGDDLFAAAKKRFGGLDRFIDRLQSQARCFKIDPVNTPLIRYVMLISTEDQMRGARQSGMLCGFQSTEQGKLMALFQETEVVVILIVLAGTHGVKQKEFRTWGTMQTPPDMTGFFKVDLNPDAHLDFRDVPLVFGDQRECFEMNVKELPTGLGEQVVLSLATAVFDRQLADLRRSKLPPRPPRPVLPTRSSRRKRSRSRDRDRDRDRGGNRDRDRNRDQERDRDGDRARDGGRDRDRNRESTF